MSERGEGTTPWRRVRAAVSVSMLITAALTLAPSAEPLRAAVVTPSCIAVPPDALGWWRGEDSVTAEIGPDLSGPIAYDTGQFGRGFRFDGSNSLEATSLPSVRTGVTVEAWVAPVRSESPQTLFSRWDFPSADDSARSYLLVIDANGDLLWSTDETTRRRPEEMRVDAPTLFDGALHHVAATWDPVQIAVYIDGQLVASRPSQGGELNAATTTPFRLGRGLGLGAQFEYTGIIDEPAVIGRALSQAEVTDLIAAGPRGHCPFSIQPGAATYNRAASARFKGSNSGSELYLGPMTSPSATPRSEAQYNDFATVGQKTYQLVVGYDVATNVLTSSITAPTATLVYDLDTDAGGGCAAAGWNTMNILVADSRTDGGVALQSVTLGTTTLGDLGTVDRPGIVGGSNWTVRGNLGRGFTLTADLVVDGFVGNEAIKVEVGVGCSP